MASRTRAVGLAVILAGCGPKAPSVAAPVVPAKTTRVALPAPAAALPPATADEQELAARLRATVQHFAVEVGERNGTQSWNLATATDDIARTLEKMGYEVRRQGLIVGADDAVVQNVEVHVSGGKHGDQTIVVGAHFDSHPGTPGADDDASGVAAVLELARVFRDQRLERTLRFVFFTNEEEPDLKTDHMGSLAYAKDLVTQGLEVVGMLNIDGIGAFSVAPGSQREPAESGTHYPSTADFLAIVGNEPSRAFLERVTASMKKHTAVPVFGDVFAAETPFSASSDHWSFWRVGIPAVMITDTAPLRYVDYHQKTDLPDRLDFDRMSRVVAGIRDMLEDVAEGG